MVEFYRLKESGVRLAAEAQIISSGDFEAVEAGSAIVEAAEKRAREIVEDAERVFKEEKRRGYAEGLRAAQLESLRRLMAEQRSLDEALREVERDIALLVESCVRKLIQSFDDSARAETAARQALATMRRERRVELRCSPEQNAFFKARADEIRRDFPEIELIDVVSDETLQADQVVVESSIGRVEADIGRRLDDLAALLAPFARMEPEENEASEEMGEEPSEQRDWAEGDEAEAE